MQAGATMVHDLLAELLTYPAPGREHALREALCGLRDAFADGAADLRPFERMLDEGAPGRLEELYAQAFDNNAERALEIGWQLHGENYDRGAFMVRMRGLLREHGVPETTELPDHLSLALRLVARMPEEDAFELVGRCVLPAVEKVLRGFGDDGDPYRGVVSAVRRVLETRVSA